MFTCSLVIVTFVMEQGANERTIKDGDGPSVECISINCYRIEEIHEYNACHSNIMKKILFYRFFQIKSDVMVFACLSDQAAASAV